MTRTTNCLFPDKHATILQPLILTLSFQKMGSIDGQRSGYVQITQSIEFMKLPGTYVNYHGVPEKMKWDNVS